MNWQSADALPELSGRFIEEVLIEYQNDLGVFHAVGLFHHDEHGNPVFLEVLTGTVIDWRKTVRRWQWFSVKREREGE